MINFTRLCKLFESRQRVEILVGVKEVRLRHMDSPKDLYIPVSEFLSKPFSEIHDLLDHMENGTLPPQTNPDSAGDNNE